MATKKIKTNRVVLNSMIKELNDFELAILRERIMTSATNVVASKEQLMVSMKDHFISPMLYVGTMERVLELVKFDD